MHLRDCRPYSSAPSGRYRYSAGAPARSCGRGAGLCGKRAKDLRCSSSTLSGFDPQTPHPLAASCGEKSRAGWKKSEGSQSSLELVAAISESGTIGAGGRRGDRPI